MTQSETWHPSDIDETPAENGAAPRRRNRQLSLDSGTRDTVAGTEPVQPAKPVTGGIMTLDRDSTAKDNQGVKPSDGKPPLDVQQRLRETAENCIRFYESWCAGNDGETDLTNGLHELRRVLARIEIELAASHADETAQRPIPIPLHRAYKHGDDTRR